MVAWENEYICKKNNQFWEGSVSLTTVYSAWSSKISFIKSVLRQGFN